MTSIDLNTGNINRLGAELVATMADNINQDFEKLLHLHKGGNILSAQKDVKRVTQKHGFDFPNSEIIRYAQYLVDGKSIVFEAK